MRNAFASTNYEVLFSTLPIDTNLRSVKQSAEGIIHPRTAGESSYNLMVYNVQFIRTKILKYNYLH